MVKVCNFLRITVEKVGYHIIPTIDKKPSNINLHVGGDFTTRLWKDIIIIIKLFKHILQLKTDVFDNNFVNNRHLAVK